MKDANRLNCQMNPPAEKMNEVGATLVNYGGGYFRSWYIINGVVNISKAVTTPNPVLWRLRNMQGKSPNLVEFTLEDQLQKERIKRALNEYWDVGT